MPRLIHFARRAVRGVWRRLFPRRVYRKVPMRIRPPLAHAEAPPAGCDWRDRVRMIEVEDATPLAGALFARRFNATIPRAPRHFVLLHSPEGGGDPVTVAYIHQQPFGEAYLTGGLCVDERAYRTFPKWLLARVHGEGGLATMLMRESIAMLGDAKAAFGHVGDLKSRQACLRAGFVDTADEHVMVVWRAPLDESDKQRLVALAAAHGPF